MASSTYSRESRGPRITLQVERRRDRRARRNTVSGGSTVVDHVDSSGVVDMILSDEGWESTGGGTV